MRNATTTIKGSLDRLLELDGELRDLSFERDDALLKLRESEHRYRALCEAGFEAIVIHRDGEVLAANNAFQDLTGYNEEELKSYSLLVKIMHPDFRKEAERRICDEVDEPYNSKLVRKDGEVVDVYIHPKYVKYNGHGLCRAAVVTIWEERKHA